MKETIKEVIGLNKGASIELSTSGIVFLILAIVILALGLWFIKGMFGNVSTNFEEQISKEPEPSLPTANMPITLSRENIITKTGSSEVIKANILNPTGEDWIFRDAVNVSAALCSVDKDGVCYLDPFTCRDKDGDPDCKRADGSHYNCSQNSELGEGIGCVIVAGGDSNKGFWYSNELCSKGDRDCNCSMEMTIGKDPDCDPTEGVRLTMECSRGLELEKMTNPKEIEAGSSTQFSMLLRIDKKAEKGSYICKLGVRGFIEETEKYARDLMITIN